MLAETTTRDVTEEIYDKLAAEAPAEAVEPAGDAGAEVAAEPADDAEPAAPTTGRDDKGRFAPKGKPAAAVRGAPAVTPTDSGAQEAAASGAATAPAVVPAPVLPELKAPQDWRAAAREKWGTLPREIQEEALRVHTETKKTLQRAAELEKTAEEWGGAVKGYEHLFPGQPPARAVAGLVQTYAQLHTAPLPQRAQILGNMIRSFLGTDDSALKMLGQVLDGSGAPAPAAHQQAPALSQEQIRQLARQEWEAAQSDQAREAAVRTWKDFETTAEFLNEPGFRQRLALELSLSMREKGDAQPSKDDIKAAYDAACQSHPGVAKIVNQRKEAAAANARRVSTPAAAAGIKNEPAGPAGAGKAKNTEEEVARQYDRLTRPARV